MTQLINDAVGYDEQGNIVAKFPRYQLTFPYGNSSSLYLCLLEGEELIENSTLNVVTLRFEEQLYVLSEMKEALKLHRRPKLISRWELWAGKIKLI